MRQASKRVPDSAEKMVRDIRRATRRHHSAEEKIRIVLEGLRGEVSIAEFCRKAARRGSTRTFIIVGRRSSWRQARSK
jgi:transposase-like protein